MSFGCTKIYATVDQERKYLRKFKNGLKLKGNTEVPAEVLTVVTLLWLHLNGEVLG